MLAREAPETMTLAGAKTLISQQELSLRNAQGWVWAKQDRQTKRNTISMGGRRE
jgi:hypothetical protein